MLGSAGLGLPLRAGAGRTSVQHLEVAKRVSPFSNSGNQCTGGSAFVGEVRWAKWYLIKKTGAPRAHQPISHLNSLEVSDRLPEEPFVTF